MNNRRNLIKGLGAGAVWTTPVAQSVLLPAHANTTAEITTTPAPTVFDLSAVLDQSQETPPTGDQATGTASMTFNSVSGAFSIVVVAVGFSDYTVSHIHVAPVGVAGPPIVNLDSGHTGNGNINYAGTIPAENRADVLAGNTYVNLHNTSHPAGAIRGQLLLD